MWQRDRELQACLLSGSRISWCAFPHHALRSWIRALWWSIYVLSAFDAGQSRLAQETLARVPRLSSFASQLPLSLRIAAARYDLSKLRTWLHLLLNDRACYAESFALCAGLRVLGWDCVLAIGYACITLNSSTPMHAWLEYEGEVIGEQSDIALGYLIIERKGGQEAYASIDGDACGSV